LPPGPRSVANGFGIDGWDADETGRADGDCGSWCTAILYIVPAQVAGTWRLPQGELKLEQSFQMVTGTLTAGGASTAVSNGRLRGDQISFSVGGVHYTGRVAGDSMRGEVNGPAPGAWTASRARQ